MKSIYTLAVLIFISLFARAQNFILNFEDTTVINQVYYTDSTLDPQHIWQIGVPNKPFFDSAYSPTNAVVTLLDSLVPNGLKASFIIILPQVDNKIQTAFLTFVHKYDFDLHKGGGYVEFSMDSGINWHNVFTTGVSRYNTCFAGQMTDVDGVFISPPTWWGTIPTDTTQAGLAYFTGTDSVWIYDTIVMPTVVFASKTIQYTPVMFKFTAFSDTISQPKAGWIIDNIGFVKYGYSCGGGINEINSSHLKIYPDPVSDGFTLSLINTDVHNYELSIIVLLSKEDTEKMITLRRGDISAGSYIVRVRDQDNGNTMEKRVLFE